jgi:hypothetical protein
MGKTIYNGYWKKKKKPQLTAHLQNRGFSARLRDSGFVLHLGSQIHFGQNSPASQMRKTLWASLKDIVDKRENNQRTTLVGLEEYFV